VTKGGRILGLALCLLLVAFAADAAPAQRLALVLGNGAYVHAPALANPPRDARAVAGAFRRLGFEVIEGIDLARADLIEALRDFGRRADGAELAVVYFAGHGIQVKGQNYVLPIDAQLQREQDLRYEAISIQAVLDEAGGAQRLRLVILDACRDNPFVARLRREMGASRSTAVGRGLKVIDEIAPDTLIAYATTADAVADDGTGGHSPYTKALLDNLETPGLELNLLFGRVRDEVMRQTNNRQQPFTYGSLGGDPIFLKPAVAASAAPAATNASNADAVELAFWNSIKDSASAADYRAYLEAFPEGSFAPLARVRIAALGAKPRHEPSVAPPAPRQAELTAEPPPVPIAKPRPPPEPRPAPGPLAAASPPVASVASSPPPPPQQEARIPPAPRPAELRTCPAAGTRIAISAGDVLSFGAGRNFVCDIGLGIPDRQLFAFVAGPDPRHIRWQGKPPDFPLQPGRRFAFISEGLGDGGSSAWYHDFVVKGPARVHTRAGDFDVVVIEETRSGWNGNEYEARLRHYWCPALGFVVKQEVLDETTNRASFRNIHNRGGPSYGPLGRQSWEAVSITSP
jgi:uncharacterized caspase-like protein